VLDNDCSPAETCDTQCLFGPPLPIPDPGTPAISYCMINHIAEDLSGSVQCNGGGTDLNILASPAEMRDPKN